MRLSLHHCVTVLLCYSPRVIVLFSDDIFPPPARPGPLPVAGSTQLSDADWMFSVGDLAEPPILILTLLPPPVNFFVITISLSSTLELAGLVLFLAPALGRVLLPWKADSEGSRLMIL